MNVKCIVPQGGVLSPLLFNLYITSIIHCVNSDIFCYADDIALFRPIQQSNDCAMLQNDMNNLGNYCKKLIQLLIKEYVMY